MPPEIPLAEAIAHLKEIEGRYQALYRYVNAPENIRRRDSSSDYRRIARLEDQLVKRMRFAWLMFVAGILIGIVFITCIAMPPVWLGAL